jgi:hypothetical protein
LADGHQQRFNNRTKTFCAQAVITHGSVDWGRRLKAHALEVKSELAGLLLLHVVAVRVLLNVLPQVT